MRIAGTATVGAPPEQVWAGLNDPAVLVRAIPGCERLEALSPDRFAMTITAGVASIKGSYEGEVELAEPSPPSAFTLRASGAGAPGTVSANVRITLAPTDGGTTVSYDADAVVGGAVGGVGQRVLSAVAKRTANEFFTALEKELSGTPEVPQAAAAPGEAAVFTRPSPAPSSAPAPVLTAALAGGALALAGVLVGWFVGRRVS